MVEEVKKQLQGTWVHTQDDNMPPFYDAVGTSELEKEYLLTSTPILKFAVKGDVIKTTHIPHPMSDPEVRAEVDFKLGVEFQFEPQDHLFKILIDWKKNRLIQRLTPVKSHTRPHTIELCVDKHGELVQTYIVKEVDGQEVRGIRRYKKDVTNS